MNSPVLRYEVPTGRDPQPVLLVARAGEKFHWGLEGHHEPGADIYLSTHLRTKPKELATAEDAVAEAVRFACALGLLTRLDVLTTPALQGWFDELNPNGDFAALEANLGALVVSATPAEQSPETLAALKQLALAGAKELRGLERAKQQGAEAHAAGLTPQRNPYIRAHYREAWLDGYYAAQKAAKGASK